MDNDFIIPCLRKDLTFRIIKDNNEELVVLYDPKGYSAQPMALPSGIFQIVQIANGELSLSELIKSIKSQIKINVNPDILIEIFKGLDEQCFLESTSYFFRKFQIESYICSPIRPAVCSGNSYPQDKIELEAMIHDLLLSVDTSEIEADAKFVIAPHIDFNIGRISHEVYASAYHSIRNSDADLFVIFGTSHNISTDIFMLSQKDFTTPLGTIKTDKDIIEKLKELIPGKFSIDELAHRYEHSIELQIIILQYLFRDRDFTILPILCGSYHEFLSQKKQPADNDRFHEFIINLKNTIKNSGKKAIFIASADLAHVGKKFQDNFEAESVLEQIKNEDEELINQLEKCNSEGFFDSIAKVNDKRRICGLSPIYSLLQSQINDNGKTLFRGKLLKYNQWNEVETGSAVSFVSIAYY